MPLFFALVYVFWAFISSHYIFFLLFSVALALIIVGKYFNAPSLLIFTVTALIIPLCLGLSGIQDDKANRLYHILYLIARFMGVQQLGNTPDIAMFVGANYSTIVYAIWFYLVGPRTEHRPKAAAGVSLFLIVCYFVLRFVFEQDKLIEPHNLQYENIKFILGFETVFALVFTGNFFVFDYLERQAMKQAIGSKGEEIALKTFSCFYISVPSFIVILINALISWWMFERLDPVLHNALTEVTKKLAGAGLNPASLELVNTALNDLKYLNLERLALAYAAGSTVGILFLSNLIFSLAPLPWYAGSLKFERQP